MTEIDFSAASSITPGDVSVRLLSGQVHIWRSRLECYSFAEAEWSRTLCVDEQLRASKFKFNRERKRCILGRLALRRLLALYLDRNPGEISIKYSEFGKPFLADLEGTESVQFNVAHSSDAALFAFAIDTAVGIDIEQIRPELRSADLEKQSRETLIHQLFEQQADLNPNVTAIISHNDLLTYSALNDLSNNLAAQLANRGVAPGCRVGICIERSPLMVAAILAVLKSGAAYVPLDAALPKQRIAYMLSDCDASLIMTDANTASDLAEIFPADRLLLVDHSATLISGKQDGASTISTSPESLAYIMYTSGSTGNPKGVQITHRSVVNLLRSIASEPGMTKNDVFLAVTTLIFDMSVIELFGPLSVGASAVIVDLETRTNGKQLAELLATADVTVLPATPTTLRLLVAAGWQGSERLKILSGGEPLSPDLADQLLIRSGSLWNMYGPTETTVYSSFSKVQPNKPILIGKPIANTQF